MEDSPCEAIKNNAMGTYKTAYAAMKNVDQESDTVVAAFYPVSGNYVSAKTVKDKNASKECTEIKKTENNKVENQQEIAQKNPEAKYTIVLASYVEKRNAEEFISNLAKDGFAEGRYVKNGKVSRVLYSSYLTEEDARTVGRLQTEVRGEGREGSALRGPYQ